MAARHRTERARLFVAVAIAIGIAASAMAADIVLDGLWHGATLYLERCATSGSWLEPTIVGRWIGDHLRAFPVSSAAMMIVCGLPGGATQRGAAGMALRIAAMVAAMPVLCGLGLKAAAAMPPNFQVAAYLATMWLLSLGVDGGLRYAGTIRAARRIAWSWR